MPGRENHTCGDTLAIFRRIKKMPRRRKEIPIVFTALIIAFLSGIYFGRSRGIPFVERKKEWSIGVYTGDSPFNLAPHNSNGNPVLRAEDVKDIKAAFVADPFAVKENSNWYMFFEVMNNDTGHGDIGLATSLDGFKWKYQQIILDEPFHLSYPYTFKWKGEFYMIPESHEAYSVRLYKADDFPAKWSFVKSLIHGNYKDSSIFRYLGKWWMFTTDRNDVLRLFYSNHLTGSWVEHPRSPVIVRNPHISRPAGRVLVFDDKIFRYAQDDKPTYGNKVRAFEITDLTTTAYNQKELAESPVLTPSQKGWNAEGMHQVDPHQISKNNWVAFVDGFRKVLVFGLKY